VCVLERPAVPSRTEFKEKVNSTNLWLQNHVAWSCGWNLHDKYQSDLTGKYVAFSQAFGGCLLGIHPASGALGLL
jgi:hypothetical protein